MLGAYMLFTPDGGVSQGYLAGWLVVLYLGFSMVALSLAGWGASLAASYHERCRLFAWEQAATVVGAIVVLLAPVLLAPPNAGGPALMGRLIVGVTLVSVLLIGLGAPEVLPPRRQEAGRLRWRDFTRLISQPTVRRLLAADLLFTLAPGLTSPLYLFFFRQARGYSADEANLMLLLFIVGNLFGVPLWAAAANRFGKHSALIAAAGCYAIAQAAIVVLPSHSTEIMAPAMFAAGAIMGALVYLVRAMIADVADEVRLDLGQDRVSLLYGLFTGTAKIGTSTMVFVSFLILHQLGFNPAPDAANTAEALRGVGLVYGVAPVIMVLLGVLVLAGYRLDARRHAEIRAALDARDAALLAAQTP